MGDLSVKTSFNSLSQLADVSTPSLFETWRINEEGLEIIGIFENITEKFKGLLAFLGFNYVDRTDDKLIKERFKEILSKDTAINGSNWSELVARAAYKIGLAMLNSKNSKLELDRSIQIFAQELLDKKNALDEKENSLANRRSSDATVISEKILSKVNDVYWGNLENSPVVSAENNGNSLESGVKENVKENHNNENEDLELPNIQRDNASARVTENSEKQGQKSEKKKKNKDEVLTTESEVKVAQYYLDDLNEAKLSAEQQNNKKTTTQEVAKDLKNLITNAYNYRRGCGLSKVPLFRNISWATLRQQIVRK